MMFSASNGYVCHVSASFPPQVWQQFFVSFFTYEKKNIEAQRSFSLFCLDALILWQVENWGGLALPPKKRGESYYGKPYPELELRLQNNFESKLKPLTNGGSTELKPKRMGKISISLNNTCAFDALVHLFATSYCDCKTFRQFVDANDSPLLNLAKHISCKGVQAEAYKMRAEMLYNNLSEDCREMAFGIVNVNCAHTPSFIALKLKTPASIIDIRVCSSRYCPYVTSGERIPVLSARPEILLKNGIQSLQEAIEANDSPDISDCSKHSAPQSYLLSQNNLSMSRTCQLILHTRSMSCVLVRCATLNSLSNSYLYRWWAIRKLL